jgi:hypothetical protein
LLIIWKLNLRDLIRNEIFLDLLNSPNQFLITTTLIASGECAVEGGAPRDDMIVPSGLPDAAIPTAHRIDGYVRVRHRWHRHIVEVIYWNLYIVQFYRLAVVVPLMHRACSLRAFIRMFLMGAVIIIREWESVGRAAGSLLGAGDLPYHVLDVALVEILEEKLVWLDLVLEAEGGVLGGGVYQLVISRIWTQVVLVYESAADLVCSLKIFLFSTVINVLAISKVAIIII